MIQEVEEHEAISHWTLMKNSEVKNKQNNKDGKLMTILSIWYYKRNILPDVRLMKQGYRLFVHRSIQQWRVNY